MIKVVFIEMEASVVGSCGIKPKPSLETGRGEEKNLQEWRLEFPWIQKTGTRLEQEQEVEKIMKAFFRKIKGHEIDKSEKSEGEEGQLENIPKLREEWGRM